MDWTWRDRESGEGTGLGCYGRQEVGRAENLHRRGADALEDWLPAASLSNLEFLTPDKPQGHRLVCEPPEPMQPTRLSHLC